MTKNRQRSIERIATREKARDQKLRDSIAKKAQTDAQSLDPKAHVTLDSFVNFAQKMGVGADNPLTSSSYGFNPITRIRTLLEWVHRGSWLGGQAVDVIADDMTKGGVEIVSNLEPKQISAIEEGAVSFGVWNALNETIKWSRLYGGCIAVMMVDGQDMNTPLRLNTIGKGQFKGLLVLDRWMVEPSLNDLVQDPGPDIGMPKYYRVTAESFALPGMKIHHSRCIRLEGIRLPYWQRVQENLWGISVLERIYDRMIAFDSATTGAAQLVYKSYLRTYKIAGLREIIAAGGPAEAGLIKYVDMMRRFQNIEGVTILDGSDEFASAGHSAFGGLSDALAQFGQQLAGALQIPLVRLFGQSPSGFSSGDTDLRMYYDSIKQRQEKDLRIGVTRVYRAIAQSEGIMLPEGFRIEFKSLWQISETEKAEIATKVTTAVVSAEESGLLSPKAAMEELRQSSHVTGVFSNIKDADIAAAEESILPPIPEATPLDDVQTPELPGTKDSLATVSALKRLHDLEVVIENPKGSVRSGKDEHGEWSVTMPADYGYIRQTGGADGDQVDCYIGPQPLSDRVWVIDQVDPNTGQFDEHKVMLGFPSLQSAQTTYLAGYTDGKAWGRIGGVYSTDVPSFKEWLQTGDTTKPYGVL